MIYDPVEEELFKIVKNKYRLVAIISKRVSQLNSGMQPLVETDSKWNTTIAIKELAEGKVKFRIKEND